jgi:multicomponent Na+:H+ antiporter subunit D
VSLTVRLSVHGPFSYALGGWGRPYGIELRFDEFSAAILFVCLVHALVLLYSGRYAERAISRSRAGPGTTRSSC